MKKKFNKLSWMKWLENELSDFDIRHKLGKYQIMADLPPGEAYKKQIEKRDAVETLKLLMQRMLSFLNGEITKQEAHDFSLFLKRSEGYAGAKPEIKYVYDIFEEITKR